MGGRGASSGMSIDKNGNPKNPYGSQYHTVLKSENIKFVTNNGKNPEALMETLTPGRVYVQTGGDNLLRIVQFDSENKRNKVIERDKRTGKWHVHKGYLHAEHGDDHEQLTNADQRMVARVEKLWHNRRKV